MLGKIGRSRRVQAAIGRTMAGYLKLVRSTGRMVIEPDGFPDSHHDHLPAVVAMWHGQHFMMPFARPDGYDVAVMISRSRDGEINAVAAERLGLKLIRASGGQRAHHFVKRGGARGFREAMALLNEGTTVALTADVPKGPARVCGPGIVLLAKMSGRPVVPMAIATSRRYTIDSWDKASVNLPFSRIALVVGEPIQVSGDAGDDALEERRKDVEAELNRVTDRAYALVDRRDG